MGNVNIGFGLGFTRGFGFKIVDVITVEQYDPLFVRVGGVDKHAFHRLSP
jgi:hypothetical protein